ncbi:MAG: flagellar hook-basal body complex protein FliE [Peptococcaceae bacterium]|nr:MAG: flagellar hook-basal body complex protein FliE [Peptococcaceae bacterium]
MAVEPVNFGLPAAFAGGGKNTRTSVNFGDVLASAVNKVNEAQLKADKLTGQFLAGEIQDVHQVTIAMQEARLTMQLALEVRNKVVEAYQEMARMQV